MLFLLLAMATMLISNVNVRRRYLRGYIQVKNNEIVDSRSPKGDRVRYIQVTVKVNIRHNFQEVVGDCDIQGDCYIQGCYRQL